MNRTNNKINLFCFTFLLTISLNHLVAQQWTWNSIVPSNEKIKLCKDNYSNIYAYSIDDTLLRKFNTNGNLIWQKNFSNKLKIQAVVCSQDSTVYIAGNFTDTLEITGQTLISRGGVDMCVAHLSTNGSLIWLKQAGSKGDDYIGDICMNGLNFATTGTAADTMHFSSQVIPTKTQHSTFFLAKYFKNGELDTVRFALFLTPTYTMNSYWAGGYEIETDRVGNFVVIAGFGGKYQIDTTSIEDWGARILKFSANLAFMWKSGPVSNYFNRSYNLRINSKNEIIYVQYQGGNHSHGVAIFKQTIGQGISTAYQSGWANIYGMNLDACDNIYFTGEYRKSHPSGDPPIEYHLLTGKVSAFTGKLSWLKKDSSLIFRTGNDIIPIGINEFYVSGFFNTKLFLKDTMIAPFTNQSGNYAYFHSKLSAAGCSGVGLTENNLTANKLFFIYPNPATSEFNVDLPFPAVVRIVNVTGQTVQTNSLQEGTQTIKLNNIERGIYFIQFDSGTYKQTDKVLIE